MQIIRDFVQILEDRIKEEGSSLIQIILGPRQVGKTTGVKEVLKRFKSTHYATADLASVPSKEWIIENWQIAKAKGAGTILVFDEIQKINMWGDTIKGLYDEERDQNGMKIVLLGSASLSLKSGFAESLLGRFELIEVPHWSCEESRIAYNYDLNQYLMFGGYPGGAALTGDVDRWQSFMRDSVIESVLSKDIFMLASINKPALLRQVLELALLHPAHELSYQKMIGQLQERGGVETIKNYMHILGSAYLVKSLEKYSTRAISVKSSSPKIVPLCPALIHTVRDPRLIATDPAWRGRVVEAAVGSYLMTLPGKQLYYWRDGKDEVDYVHVSNQRAIGIEVKSGSRNKGRGVAAFREHFPKIKCVTLNEELIVALFGKKPGPTTLEWLHSIAI